MQILEQDPRFQRLEEQAKSLLRGLVSGLWRAYLEALEPYRTDPHSLPIEYRWTSSLLDRRLAEGVIQNCMRQEPGRRLPPATDLADLHFDLRQKIAHPDRIFPWPPTRHPQPRTRDFGQMLRTAREEAGLTLDGFTARLEVTKATVSHWELGRSRPKLDNLYRLMDISRALQRRRTALYEAWAEGFRALGIADREGTIKIPARQGLLRELKGPIPREEWLAALSDRLPKWERELPEGQRGLAIMLYQVLYRMDTQHMDSFFPYPLIKPFAEAIDEDPALLAVVFHLELFDFFNVTDPKGKVVRRSRWARTPIEERS